MLTEFETRLADVLGSRLPAPFGGRVRRRAETAPNGTGPVVRVGVDAIEPLDPDLGSVRPEVVGGSSDHRRIVRLGVTLGILVEPEDAGDRLQELAGIDALVHGLQDPGMRTASLLVQPGDQGFLVDFLDIMPSDLSARSALLLRTEGWFWPVGVAGHTGRPIQRALVREFRLPMQLSIAGPIRAGGADVDLDVTFGATGVLEVTRGQTTTSPFGLLALRLFDDGGGPGAGTLSGGQSGPQGSRLVTVTEGTASVTYGPPGTAASDHLVVAAYATDGNERVGMELARFDLVVSR
ncbi:hypothetical protein FHX52_0803 [Humibacillus xanthopallidus]|uniref:Uncharacterized protein n=1 Tax=Humibacillus xanthopallidus TaxID=412689 RepID=A0A543PUE2_9MICO|nr:hypothetical protein [Humibacillus xanthopallidus]TQN47694.1 hypothetical protein FHX52_0803 [Humibacillus xanthopallidus]